MLPKSHFLIGVFKTTFRYDRNSNGGGILKHVRNKVPVNEIKQANVANSIESLLNETNLVKKKRDWSVPTTLLLVETNFLLNTNFVIAGDLNAEETNHEISSFMDFQFMNFQFCRGFWNLEYRENLDFLPRKKCT